MVPDYAGSVSTLTAQAIEAAAVDYKQRNGRWPEYAWATVEHTQLEQGGVRADIVARCSDKLPSGITVACFGHLNRTEIPGVH